LITYVHGDLFTSPARVLVNPVNTVGTMSAGVSEDFKQVYPAMFAQYQTICEADSLAVGQAFLYKTPHKWILNLPLKKHYRAQVKLDAVELALRKIASLYADHNFTSLSLPALGVGDGISSLDEIKPLLTSYLGNLPIMCYVHLPADTRLGETRHNITTLSKWLLGTPQDVTFETFWRGVSSIVRRHPTMTTLENGTSFQTQFRRDENNPKLMSLKIIPQDGETLFIPQTLLRDLWQYLLTSHYAHPRHFPGGLDAQGEAIVTVLSKLSYVRPVLIQPPDRNAAIGVQYIPPAEREAAVVSGEMF
jgi:O-acetyl-ADP-ribose deacetylase (regulator of RNase III)